VKSFTGYGSDGFDINGVPESVEIVVGDEGYMVGSEEDPDACPPTPDWMTKEQAERLEAMPPAARRKWLEVERGEWDEATAEKQQAEWVRQGLDDAAAKREAK
jgi:hypothetical protein